MFTDQFKTAFTRAVLGAVVTAGATFFTTLATGQTLRIAGIAAGAAFFTYLVARGGIEGLIDTQQAATKPAPVPPAPPSVP